MERGSVSYSVRAFVPMKTLLIIENIKVLSLLKILVKSASYLL